MAAKKCPNCSSECPVASSSCKTCLHVFKSRKGSTSTASGGQMEDNAESFSDDRSSEFGSCRRYTGRVTRTKPNFYDSLHVEEQMKQRKLLQRKQLKQAKFGDQKEDNSVGKQSGESKDSECGSSRKKRGRPSSSRIGIGGKMSSSQLSTNRTDVNQDKVAQAITPEDDTDIMLDVSPEKALQFNIVLNEINRKWSSANWNTA